MTNARKEQVTRILIYVIIIGLAFFLARHYSGRPSPANLSKAFSNAGVLIGICQAIFLFSLQKYLDVLKQEGLSYVERGKVSRIIKNWTERHSKLTIGVVSAAFLSIVSSAWIENDRSNTLPIFLSLLGVLFGLTYTISSWLFLSAITRFWLDEIKRKEDERAKKKDLEALTAHGH